jgi:hypothetical protein
MESMTVLCDSAELLTALYNVMQLINEGKTKDRLHKVQSKEPVLGRITTDSFDN